MNKIVCYKKGCNHLAQWTISGKRIVHLCTKCMRELFPNQNIVVQRVERLPEVGPTEFKNGEDEDVKENS